MFLNENSMFVNDFAIESTFRYIWWSIDHNTVDWTKIRNENLSSDEMASQFYEIIWPKFEACFTLKKVRSSSRDPPFMSPLVKYLLKKRKQAMRRNDR